MKHEIYLALAALIEQEEEEVQQSRTNQLQEDQDDSMASALLSLRNVAAATWNRAQPLCHPGALSSFSSSSSPIIRSALSGPGAAGNETLGVTPISDDEDDGESLSRLLKRNAYRKRNHLALDSRSNIKNECYKAKAGRGISPYKRLRRTATKPRAVIALSTFITQDFVGRPLPPAPCLPRLAPGQRLPPAYSTK
jgi:hypothetical protein